jgi:hypothetical protein
MLVALVVGCAPRSERPLASQKALAVAPDFFVVAEGGEGTPEYSSFLHLCVIDATVFLCGRGLVFADGRFVEDKTELSQRGVYRGLWNPPIGHLPDEVYVLDEDKAPGSENALNPLGVYRFAQGRWAQIGSLGPGAEHRVVNLSFSPWTPGRVIVADELITDEGDRQSELKTLGEGNAPPIPQRTIRRDDSGSYDDVWSVHAFPDGAVVLWHGDFIERWSHSTWSSRLIDLAPHACSFFTWHVSSPSDIVLLGGWKGRVCGARVTAAGLEELADVSTIEGEVRDYAREPSGGEWLVAGGALWNKPGAGNWQRVNLPSARFSKAQDVPLEPLQVWAPENDRIWVKAHYKEPSGEDQGVILHNLPPASVCRVASRGCEP